MGSPTRFSAHVLAGVSIASTLLLLGCQAGAGTPASTPTAAPTVSSTTVAAPALTESYTSAVYGYSMNYPEYFTVRPATRRLEGAETPWVDSAGIDQLNASATIVIGSGDLAPGMDLDGWIGKAVTPICAEPASTEAITIGGEPGRLLTYPGCNGFFHLWATTMHGPAGYHLVWFAEPGNEAEGRLIFDAILATFTFGAAPPVSSPSPS